MYGKINNMNAQTAISNNDSIIKVVQALGYLLSLDNNQQMSRVKLIKLLWAADRFHMRKYGRTVTESEYVAMMYGPVSSMALNIAQLKQSRFAFSDEDIKYLSTFFMSDDKETGMTRSPGTDHLSETDKEELKRAWDTFGGIDAFEMVDDISHRYPEWRRYAVFFDAGERASRPIYADDFFDDPENDQYFAEPDDVKQSARAIYKERQSAKRALDNAAGV